MWEHIGIAALFGAVGILLSALGYRVFDVVETRIDFSEELKKGNMAAAVVISAFIVGVCFIVGRAVGG